jgi:hypothetical protein
MATRLVTCHGGTCTRAVDEGKLSDCYADGRARHACHRSATTAVTTPTRTSLMPIATAWGMPVTLLGARQRASWTATIRHRGRHRALAPAALAVLTAGARWQDLVVVRVSTSLVRTAMVVAFSSPVVVNVVLRASALQQIRATIAVSASQGCPIAFDVDAYAAKVAADASVTVDRVTVTVVCRDGQPALASGDQRRRSVQSDAAELIITVTITELTAAQAAVVSACCRVPRCMRVADISPLRSCLAVSHSPVFPAVLSLRVSLLVSLCRSVS